MIEWEVDEAGAPLDSRLSDSAYHVATNVVLGLGFDGVADLQIFDAGNMFHLFRHHGVGHLSGLSRWTFYRSRRYEK